VPGSTQGRQRRRRFQRLPSSRRSSDFRRESRAHCAKTRLDNGALEIETVEARAVSQNGKVTAIERTQKNSATDLIEDFMIGVNSSVARFLEAHHVSSIRRIVRSRNAGEDRRAGKEIRQESSAAPDPMALHDFMLERRASDPTTFPILSLAVVKLLGPGEYILDQPGVEEPGHFGLAVRLHTLDRAQPALRGSDYSARPEGGALERSTAVQRRRADGHRAQLHAQGRRRPQSGANRAQDRRGDSLQ